VEPAKVPIQQVEEAGLGGSDREAEAFERVVVPGDPTEPLDLLLSLRSEECVVLGHDHPFPRSGWPEQGRYYINVTVRVLLVDPQPFFCEALRIALNEADGIEVVGSANDELEAERLVDERGPDIVLTEVELAGGSGLSLVRRVGEKVATVVLTRHHEGDVLLDVVSAGAVGCVGHDLSPEDIAELVRRAAEGRFAVNQERLLDTLKRASATRTPSGEGQAKLAALTVREREILGLVARGLDNQAIAERLHLSTHTARTHVGNILRKLGAHSRAEAARLALREGQADTEAHVLRIRGPDLGSS
jgi:DNA-binding NarL/FixJ family response regulator